MKDKMMQRVEWCRFHNMPRVQCGCKPGLATLKKTTKEGLGAVRD